MIVLDIEAYPKPRETRRDIWNPRSCVIKYREYKDKLREELNKNGFILDDVLPFMVFVFEMPKSWSKKKRLELNGKLHKSKPDLDNLEKGFLDCIFDKISKERYNFTKLIDDKEVCIKFGCMKVWGEKSQIIIYDNKEFINQVYNLLN